MPGPVMNFVENLRERRPVRNAIRGMLGMEPQYGPPAFDSMQSISARDQELGGDVMDDRETRRGPAATQVAYGTEEQPYRGMGMIESMFTAPSDAIARGAKKVPATPVSLPEVEAPEQMAEVEPPKTEATMASMPNAAPRTEAQPAAARQAIVADPEMSRIEKFQRLADTYALQAIHDPDPRRSAELKSVADSYMKLAEAGRNREFQRSIADRSLSTRMTIEQRQNLLDRSKQNQLDIVTAVGDQELRLAKDAAGLQSRDYLMNDVLAPLRSNRALPVESYAQNEAAAQRALNVTNKAAPEAGVGEAYRLAFLQGMGVRVNQHVKDYIESGVDADAPVFGEGHPGMEEFKFHYKQRVLQEPDNYDALRAEVGSVVFPSVLEATRGYGIPPQATIRYATNLVDEILGPRPESVSLLESMGSFLQGE